MHAGSLIAVGAAALAAACGSTDSDTVSSDAESAPSSSAASPPSVAKYPKRFGDRGDRIFEVRETVPGEGAPVASNNYFCTPCSLDAAAARAFDRHVFADPFSRSVRRSIEAARVRLFPPENSRKAPVTIDLVGGIAGAELVLGAQPQQGKIIGGGVIVTMESTRRLEWDSGDTVLEASDGEHTYVMFAEVREPGTIPPNEAPLPEGWTLEKRNLDEPFVLEEVPRVVVFLQLPSQHLWQRIDPP